MHVMGVDNPYDLLDTFKKYSLKKLSAQIKQDVLLLAGEEDDIPLSMYYEQKTPLSMPNLSVAEYLDVRNKLLSTVNLVTLNWF